MSIIERRDLDHNFFEGKLEWTERSQVVGDLRVAVDRLKNLLMVSLITPMQQVNVSDKL